MAQSAADPRPPRRFAVFLDRDGVLNRPAAEGAYIRSRDEFELLPGVAAALAELQRAGAALIVVTNQRGVARKLVEPRELGAIHQLLDSRLAEAGVGLAGIYVCPHEKGACDCRKPGTGLFTQARNDMPWISFASSEMVGDSISDVRAGHALGIRTWVVGAKREAVLAEASANSVSVAGDAESLAALVADPAFRSAVGLHVVGPL